MYRKGVSVLIVNKKEEFLLVNLESFETKYFAIPGGGLEEGESVDEAAYREIEEEVGITKESLELVGISKIPLQFIFKRGALIRDGKEYIGSERHFFAFRFLGTDDEIKLQENEVRAYKWVTFSDLKDYLLFDNQLDDTKEKIIELFPLYARE